ncbi:c-type cytochrome domain-containing protein [Fimbriiglobus ruber]|nr:c-type cytochrome domain-containing protein [Fimbriiglobus ruber]
MATKTNRSRDHAGSTLPRKGREFVPPRRGEKPPAATGRGIGIAALGMLLFAGVLVGFMMGFGKSEKKPSRVRAEVAQATPSSTPATTPNPLSGSTTPPPLTHPEPQPEPKKPEPKKPEPKKPEPKKEEAKKPEPKKPDPKPKTEPKTAVTAVPFAKVAAIFKSNCLLCHGDPTIKGGLDIRSIASIKKGGDSGPGIMPGVPAKSQLWMSIENGEMPPPNKPQLTDAEKKLIKDWIASGAN